MSSRWLNIRSLGTRLQPPEAGAALLGRRGSCGPGSVTVATAHEATRIISARRASKKERRAYKPASSD